MGYEVKPQRATHGLPEVDRHTRDLLMGLRKGLLAQAAAIEVYLNIRPAVEHCPYCGRVFGGHGIHLEKFEAAVKLEEEVADGE